MVTAPKQFDSAPHDSAIPIIVGVTGHRDLRPADIPQLKGQVRAILNDLRAKHPATPLLVLSPLAEGADRLVADVTLEEGARLVVPLPMPRAEYEKDFGTQESKNDFSKLLGQAWKCFELPVAPGNTSANIQSPGPERNRQYTQVGAYVARHSHILIALWDGEKTGEEGGTGQIVDFKLDGIPPPYARARKQLDIVDNGPVYHIVTPRTKNPNPKDTPFKLIVTFPIGWKSSKSSSESLEKAYGRILEQMNTFNDDARRLRTALAGNLTQNRDYVIPEAETPALSERARFILDRYALADTLAQHYKKRRRLTLITLFSIAVAALLSFEVYAHLIGRPWVLMLYPLSLGGAFALYKLTIWKNYQNKHLDYRALAEGERVQLFWNLAGLSEDVAEHYLRQHRTELEWIRNAIRAWNVVAEDTCLPESPVREANDETAAAPALDIVAKHWVEDQRRFFEDSKGKDRKKLSRHERIATCFFLFGLGLAIAVAALHLLRPEFGEEHSPWRNLLIVIMGMTPAIAAAIGGYAEKMAYSAQAKRYDWMNSLYERAANKLTNLVEHKDRTGAQQLIFDLGKEALEENGDWVMIHRERTADVYKGA